MSTLNFSISKSLIFLQADIVSNDFIMSFAKLSQTSDRAALDVRK
jgi:hypothetical protein